MLVAAVAFAAMGACAHAVAPNSPWQITAMVRTFLALVLAATLAYTAGAKFVVWRPATLWLRSISGTISLIGIFYSVTVLPIGDVLTVSNIYPLWIALLSWPILGQRLTAGVWLAIACGVGGVAIIQQPHFADNNFAILAPLLSSFTSALAMIGLNRLQGIDSRAIVAHFSAVSLLGCTVAFLILPRTPTVVSSDFPTWVLLLSTGLTATIGQLLLTVAFKAGTAAKVSVVGLTQVCFGLLFDVLFFGREVAVSSLLGMALVVAPTAWLMLQSAARSAEPIPVE